MLAGGQCADLAGPLRTADGGGTLANVRHIGNQIELCRAAALRHSGRMGRSISLAGIKRN